MAAADPQKMALEIAGLRAAESILPKGDQVFNDPYAALFFTPDEQKNFKTPEQANAIIFSREKVMPGMNGAIVSRIRFIDETLKNCVKEGFKQVVIIGAGYDTRAFRIEGTKERLTFFEVDHPDTQKIKMEKVKQIFGRLPGHVTYVPVMFGRDQLGEKLLETGYRQGIKTLFIIEGLLMYIPPEAVDGLLRFITKASCPGSALVADYFHQDVIKGTSTLKEAVALKQFVENAGSRLMFGLEPKAVNAFFTQRGFHTPELVSTASCKALYFKGKSRERSVSPILNFVTAIVN